MHPEDRFGFWRAFRRLWRDSIRHYGLPKTLKQTAQALWRLLLEYLPGRRKTKFGDLDYDFDHMVDTTRANVGFRTQLFAALTGHQYFPTEPWLFEEIMSALPINSDQFTFIDLGSGKGRVLVMASAYPFRKIIGVEFMPGLHQAALENIARLPADVRGVCSFESLCMDARDFRFPPGPLVVYLFNPFPEPVLAAVLEHLRQSLADHPRPVFLAYRFPEFEALLKKCAWLEKLAGTGQWTVYQNRTIR